MNFLAQVLRIVVIDLVLSGDNAVVIGMAAHRLEPRQRRVAIFVGGAGAIVLRISLTAVAAILLKLQGLELVGGILLLWLAYRMLKQEEESHDGVKEAATLAGAVSTILIADFIMSLDNVLGVAGASEGNISLLVFGLVFSMAILMFMGNMVADWINKVWWLAYVGSGVIAWTGAAMIFEDGLIRSRVSVEGAVLHGVAITIALATLALAHFHHRRN